MIRQSFHAPNPSASHSEANALYHSDLTATSEPWLHLTASSPVTGGDLTLTVTTWIHHDTAWMAVTGPLVARTTPTLETVFARLHTTPFRETVLNLCGLTNLDPDGVRCITAELHHSTQRGRRLDVVASWTTNQPSPPPRDDESDAETVPLALYATDDPLSRQVPGAADNAVGGPSAAVVVNLHVQ